MSEVPLYTRTRPPRPLETRKGCIIKTVYAYKSHVTSPFQAFGHGLTVYWETVRVTSTNLTIQRSKYALFSSQVEPEAGSYLRLIDSCINQLKAQGPSRTCNESKEEEEWNPSESFKFPRKERTAPRLSTRNRYILNLQSLAQVSCGNVHSFLATWIPTQSPCSL